MSPEQFLVAEAGRRGETDYRFRWWSYVGWTILTFGFFSDYATYKLIERRNAHVQRRLAFSSYLWHALADRAETLGRRSEVQDGLDNLSRIHAQIEAYERANTRDPALWTALRLVARLLLYFAVPGAFVNHFLNKDLRFLDTWERSMAENVDWVLQRLGLGHTGRVATRTRHVPERNTALYVLLTFLTMGLFAVWWRYATMTDGNTHFDEDDAMEDAILAALGLAGEPPPPPVAGPEPPAMP